MSEIAVNYGTIIKAGEDCDNTGTQLQHSFDSLKDSLKPLITNWSGSAKDAYGHAQAEWDKSFEELKQILAQLGSALPRIAESYKGTDDHATKLFEG